jgi:galactokinase
MARMPTTDNAELTAFAPGRVNLIGEFTDYNEGLALPFAITAGVRVSARPGRVPGTCLADARDIGETDSFLIADPDRRPGWRAFVRGMVAELGAAGIAIPACELDITGDLPRGAGLSSSAALEVALGLGLIALSGAQRPDDLTLAQLCSRVENTWVGAQSGLLDQLASICSAPEHALLIDFRSLAVTRVPLELDDYTLVAVDSGEEHSLAESGYNARRAECQQAAAALGLPSLRDATLADADSLPAPLDRRVRHLVGENTRVLEAVDSLAAGDLDALGELLNASHVSLRDDYEVSTPAVERTVDRLMDHGAVGARIMGGGFGGSVLALLPPELGVPEGAMVLEAGGAARIVDDGGAP